MDKTLFPQKDDASDGRNSLEGIQKSIYPNQLEINIADGGEFLDDGIRIKDQPFGETTVRNE